MNNKYRNARYKKNKTRRRLLVFCVETLLILVIVACCYVISKLDKMEQSSLDASDIVKPTYQNNSYAEKMDTGYKNILIVGVDARDNNTLISETNSDVLIVCSINNETKDVKLISIYRDTYLKMQNGEYRKANYQLMHGTVIDTINMLNENLDLQIDDYVVVNWAAVANVINLLGGIEVEVTDTMLSYKNQINGYITEIVESTGIGSVQIKQAGYQLLDGVQTVAYARIRYQNGDDYGRTQRQREVIAKILEKAKKASPAKWNSIADAIFPQVATSLDLAEILSMLPNLTKYTITDTAGFPFNSQAVSSAIGPQYVREAVFPVDLKLNVIQLHKILFGTENYEPSDDVIEISNEIVSHCELVPAADVFLDEVSTEEETQTTVSEQETKAKNTKQKSTKNSSDDKKKSSDSEDYDDSEYDINVEHLD